MLIKWKYSVNINRVQIEATLSQLGVMLPKDFIDVVAQHNSGSPEPHCFKLDNGEEKVMSYLLSFDLAEKRNIVSVARKMKEILPLNVIPIADDPFGNFIAYEFDESNNPYLVYWNHENLKLFKIKATFTELLESLK